MRCCWPSSIWRQATVATLVCIVCLLFVATEVWFYARNLKRLNKELQEAAGPPK